MNLNGDFRPRSPLFFFSLPAAVEEEEEEATPLLPFLTVAISPPLPLAAVAADTGMMTSLSLPPPAWEVIKKRVVAFVRIARIALDHDGMVFNFET